MSPFIRRALLPVAFFTCCLAPGLAAAGPNAAAGAVSGSVTTSDGAPIGDAIVSLRGATSTQSQRTDRSGRFSVADLPAGTYSVRVSAPGYGPLGPRPISVHTHEMTAIALALSRSSSSLVTIGRIQANGGEALSTSSAPTTAINAQTAAADGFTRVSDVLQDDVSTTLVHPAGGGSTLLPTPVALRGPDPTETLVDIDGHQVNSGSTGDFDLSLLDPADYANIELVKGISPSSLVGPDTIDGAINIRTLEPTLSPHGLLRLSAGSFNTFGETLQNTGTAGRLGYAFSLHGTTSDGEVYGPVFDIGSGGRADVGSSVDGKTALGKVRYAFGRNGAGYAELSFHDQSVKRDISAALSAYPDPSASGPSDVPVVAGFEGSSLAAHNAAYGLDVRVPLGRDDGSGSQPASFLFRHFTSLVSQSVFGTAANASPYLYNDRDASAENSLEVDKQFAIGSLTLQYSIRNEILNITGADAGSGDINLQSIAWRAPVESARYRAAADARRTDAGLSAAQDFTSTDTSTTTLGQTQRSAVLRYTFDPTALLHFTAAAYDSDYSTFGHEIDPRFGFVYTPNSRSALRLSVGTTYQAPQLPERYVPAVLPAPVNGYITTGNPHLQPDHATEYGLGASHVVVDGPHRSEISVDLYRVNLRTPATTYVAAGNADSTCGAVAAGGDGTPCLLSYAVNAGGAIYQGIELSAARLLAPYMTLRAGYAVRSAYLTSVPPQIQDGTFVLDQQTLGLSLQKGTLALTVAPPHGLTFHSTLVYEGQYNELNEPPFVTLAAAIGYRWPSLEIVLSGTNLTNVYDGRFTATGRGVPQALNAGYGFQPTDAYVLQGSAFTLSVARRF